MKIVLKLAISLTHKKISWLPIYIIRSQEKNLNLNRDLNLGPPDLLPGALPLEPQVVERWARNPEALIPVQVQIFLLRSDNVNFRRHKL